MPAADKIPNSGSGAVRVSGEPNGDLILKSEALRVVAVGGESEGTPALVDDLTFAVARGERLGVIGESGSGKSLTALAIAGLLPAGLKSSGSIELAGTQIVGANERVLNGVRGAAVSIVFQEPLSALDPLMRVGAQIARPLRRHRGLRGAALDAAVLEAMAEVSLPDPERLRRSFPHEISGGQRQRVAIAMALACQPDLLIADEPTTALDVTVQAEILALLDGVVRDRGMALIFVSHDIAVVSGIVDRVLVLQNGRIVEEGPVAEVISAPKHPYAAALVQGARDLDAVLATGLLPARLRSPRKGEVSEVAELTSGGTSKSSAELPTSIESPDSGNSITDKGADS